MTIKGMIAKLRRALVSQRAQSSGAGGGGGGSRGSVLGPGWFMYITHP